MGGEDKINNNSQTQQSQNPDAAHETVGNGDVEIINGVACPIDPMERLQCESCQ